MAGPGHKNGKIVEVSTRIGVYPRACVSSLLVMTVAWTFDQFITPAPIPSASAVSSGASPCAENAERAATRLKPRRIEYLGLRLLCLLCLFEVLLEERPPRAHGNVACRHPLQANHLDGEGGRAKRPGFGVYNKLLYCQEFV